MTRVFLILILARRTLEDVLVEPPRKSGCWLMPVVVVVVVVEEEEEEEELDKLARAYKNG